MKKKVRTKHTTAFKTKVALAATFQVDADAPSPAIAFPAGDPNGDPLRFAIVTGPSHGTLLQDLGGSITYDAPVLASSSWADVGSTIRYRPNPGYTGLDTVVFTARDGQAVSGQATLTFDVRGLNRSPQITSPMPSVATEDTLLTYNLVATDPDGDVLTYGLVRGPGAINAATGVYTWTPSNNDVGEHTVVLSVSDGRGATVRQTGIIRVQGGADAPTITSTPPANALALGADLSYPVTATDPDRNDTLTYTLEFGPSTARVDRTSGLLTFRPTLADVGPNEFIVRVTDSTGLFDRQTFAVQVVYGNRAPSITGSPPVIATVGEAWTYAPTIADPDGDAMTVSVLQPSGPSVTAGIVSWTPTAQQAGRSHEVILRVQDALGLSGTQRFFVDVVAANSAPLFRSAPTQRAVVSQAYAYDVLTWDPDPSDTLTLQLVSGPSWLSLVGARLQGTAQAIHVGAAPVHLRVSDGRGGVADQRFQVFVGQGNRPPVFNPPNPPTTAVEDLAYIFPPVVTDPDLGDVATVSITSQPGGMAIIDGLLRWVPTNAQVGARAATLRATDLAGATADLSFTVTVANTNDPPRITSTPVTVGTEDAAYTYAVTAVDDDAGDSRIFSLTTAPLGMGIGPTSGVITWTPTQEQVGMHPVVAVVTDAAGASASQSFVVAVSNVNDPPVFLGVAPTTARVGIEYVYAPEVRDYDPGDTVTILGTTLGTGATLSAGTLRWRPTAADVGTRTFVLTARDSANAATTRTWTVTVAPDTTPPSVEVTTSPRVVDPGQSVTVTVVATDDDLATVTLSLNGQSVALSGTGATRTAVVNTTGMSPGPQMLSATATDGTGRTSAAEARFGLRDGSDTVAPVVSVASPQDDQVVTLTSSVQATIEDPNIVGWRVVLERQGDASFSRLLASGSAPQSNANVAVVDATFLPNALYRLRFEAWDAGDHTTVRLVPIEVAGEAKLGVVQLTTVDAHIRAASVPLAVVRSYDSRDNGIGEFGYGWRLDLRAGSLQHNRAPGDGWEFVSSPPPFPVSCATARPIRSHRTLVRLSDTEWYMFELEIDPSTIGVYGGGCDAQARYRFLDGSADGASLAINSNRNVLWLAGTDQLVGDGETSSYSPNDVTLSLPDGRHVRLSLANGVESITDRGGNRLVFGPGGIIEETSGRLLRFTYDTAGRVSEVDMGGGRIWRYRYSLSGDLESVTDPVSQETRYRYDPVVPHRLVEVIEPDGISRSLFEYDSDGRLARSCAGATRCLNAAYDLVGRHQEIADASGRTTRFEFDHLGRVTRATNPLGHVTSWSYTSDTRIETNPLGETTIQRLDARGRLVEKVEPHGLEEDPADFTSTYEYDSFGQLSALVLPSGARLAFGYDASGQLQSLVDPAGETILHRTYDSQGRLLVESGRVGTHTVAYSSDGLEETSIDGDGAPWLVRKDANGEVANIYTPDGRTWSFQTDLVGRRTLADYGDGLIVQFGYQGSDEWTLLDSPTTGRMERVRVPGGTLGGYNLPDGEQVRFEYDNDGRLLAENSARGAYAYQYDAAGRRTSVTDPSGAVTHFAYDAAGNMTSMTNALGHVRTMGYRPGGRPAWTEDALGNRWLFDGFGNVASTTDPLGRVFQTIMSPGGLPVQTIFPDGTVETTTYLGTLPIDDADERPLTRIDAAGRVRRFGYSSTDASLVSATNLTGGATLTVDRDTWHYGYTRGGLASVQFPSGQTFALRRDAVGRLVETEPSGLGATRMTYGVNGQVAEILKPSGQTIQLGYDVAGRLISHRPAGEVPTLFSFGPGGILQSVDDEAGQTRFAHDAAGRVIEATAAAGGRVAYRRDPLGRIDQVRVRLTTTGQDEVTSYTFDPADRLVSVTDPRGGVTSFTYDAAGRRLTRTLPNGVETSWTYDVRDRTSSVTHRSPGGQVISSFVYTRGATGEPTRVVYEDGSRVDLSYDPAFRVASETSHDSSGALTRRVEYTYNADGERAERIENGVSDLYAYGNAHRLTSVSSAAGPASSTTFSWDSNGRRSAQTDASGTTTLSYTARDALREVRASGALVARYVEDGLGRRVLEETPSATRSRIWAQDPSERRQVMYGVAGGSAQEVFVYVVERPLMAVAATGVRYLLEDGLGSVIGEVSPAGNFIGRARFDSFGRVETASGTMQSGSSPIGGRFAFQGEWQEQATGLYHLRAREYDPMTGQFLTRDPAQGNPLLPESFHPYVFANGNPAVYRDPSGMFSLIGLNVGMSTQSTLRNAQTAAVNVLKEEMKSRARGVVTDILSSSLESLLPVSIGGDLLRQLSKFSSDSERGTMLGQWIAEALCSGVRGTSFSDALWIEVSMDPAEGEPEANGIHCRGSGACFQNSTLDIAVGRPRPDLLFSSRAPLELEKHGPKSYLVGEIKLSTERARKSFVDHPGSQSRAILGHARNYEYGRTVLIVAAYPGTAADADEISGALLSRGVYGFLLEILGGTSRKTRH